jgi:hypothetical protein
MSKIKHYKEEQIFDSELMYSDNKLIWECYNHFQSRFKERYVENKGTSRLPYLDYWDNWVKYLRGKLAYMDDDKMIRVIGNYIKDPSIYKIIYVKIKLFNIYVPLTIMEISDQKQKILLYKCVVESNKKTE